MSQRITELEARVSDLERALEVQAVLIGRLLNMGPAAEERFRWSLELGRNLRLEDVAPATKRLIDRLHYGQVMALAPTLDALEFPG
jgi:hypothetical protein